MKTSHKHVNNLLVNVELTFIETTNHSLMLSTSLLKLASHKSFDTHANMFSSFVNKYAVITACNKDGTK